MAESDFFLRGERPSGPPSDKMLYPPSRNETLKLDGALKEVQAELLRWTERDAAAERAEKPKAGCLTLLLVGGGVFSAFVAAMLLMSVMAGTNARYSSPVGPSIVLALSLLAVVIGVVRNRPYKVALAQWKETVGFDVDNRRLETPLCLLQQLAPELAGAVATEIDLRRFGYTAPAREAPADGGKVKRSFVQPWLALKLKLIDGTGLRVTSTLRVQERIKSKRKYKKGNSYVTYQTSGRFAEQVVVEVRRREQQGLRSPSQVMAALQKAGAPVSRVDPLPGGLRITFKHCEGSYAHWWGPLGPPVKALRGRVPLRFDGESDLLDGSMCLRMVSAAFFAATRGQTQAAG